MADPADDLYAKLGITPQSVTGQVVPFPQKAKPLSPQTQQAADDLNNLTPPQAPQLQNVPSKAPPPIIGDPLKAMSGPMAFLATLAGALTRNPIASALSNATGFVKGFQEGNEQVTKQRLEEFRANVDAAVAHNGQLTNQYKLDLDNYGHNAAKLQQHLLSTAMAHGDDIVKSLIDSGQIKDAIELIKAREQSAARLQEHSDSLQLRMTLIQQAQQTRVDGAWKPATIGVKQEDGTVKYVNGEYNGLIQSGLNPDGFASPYRDQQGKPIPLNQVDTHLTGASSQLPTDATVQGYVGRRLTGEPATEVVPGFSGSGSVGIIRQQVEAQTIQQIVNDTGMTPQQAGAELANRQNQYLASRNSEKQLTTMRGATVAATQQLDFQLSQASKVMQQIGGDAVPVLNAIERGEERWTGDPKYSQLFLYMSAATQEAARIMSGGQASVAQLREGAREEAKQWLDANWTTPQQFAAIKQTLQAEATNRVKNYDDAINYQKATTTGTPNPLPGSSLPAPSSDSTTSKW